MLNYVVEGSGPRVSLLHPIGLDHSSWRAVIDLLKHDYTVIAIDAPGHGASPLLPGEPGLKDYAGAIHETLAANGLLPTSLVGLSFGGMLTQHLATAYPEDFPRIAIAGCTVDFPEQVRSLLVERGQSALEGGMASVIEATMSRWFTAPFLESPEAQAVRKHLEGIDPAGWAAGWTAISKHDCASDLASLACPALCIAGELDLAAPPDALKRMASIIPDARFLIIEKAPHMMQIETPDRMAAAIRAILERAEVQ